jgi:hypothetical protein
VSDLTAAAKNQGIKYFLVSYTDLFGVQRAKLVPAAAIGDMVRTGGATFAGFATWLDMTPANSDMYALPTQDGSRMLILSNHAGRQGDRRPGRRPGEALLRSVRAHAPRRYLDFHRENVLRMARGVTAR